MLCIDRKGKKTHIFEKKHDSSGLNIALCGQMMAGFVLYNERDPASICKHCWKKEKKLRKDREYTTNRPAQTWTRQISKRLEI